MERPEDFEVGAEHEVQEADSADRWHQQRSQPHTTVTMVHPLS